MKTSAKHFGLVVSPRPGDMSQNDPKTTSLMTSVTKTLVPICARKLFNGSNGADSLVDCT